MGFKLLTVLLAIGALWLILTRGRWLGGKGGGPDRGRGGASPAPKGPGGARPPARPKEPVDLLACERCGAYVPAGERCACPPESAGAHERDGASPPKGVLNR